MSRASVRDSIVDFLRAATTRHHARIAQARQMLRNRGSRNALNFGKLAHRFFSPNQLDSQAQSIWMAKYLQELDDITPHRIAALLRVHE